MLTIALNNHIHTEEDNIKIEKLKSFGLDNDKIAIFLYGCTQGVKFVKGKPVVFNLVK